MAINFVPKAGHVLMCDFRDFKPPEMTKVRHVIVISPRERRFFPGTYIVVPVSMTPSGTGRATPCRVQMWQLRVLRSQAICVGPGRHGYLGRIS
jgi:uncharacterized protein YifN (PemK superfamily)